MANITQAYNRMLTLEELSEKDTPIHKINPVIKLVVTLAYLIFVTSYGKYDISGLIPMLLYPIVIAAIGDIPVRQLLTGMAAAAPLVIGVGVFNPILDRTVVFYIWGTGISAGMLSFAALLIKCTMTVTAALLLLGTTGMNKTAAALHRLHVPHIFIIQLLLTYRYISVLVGETSMVYNAYTLRAPGRKGISRELWGPLTGSLLLRTYDRAIRIYQAMKLRGFDSRYYGVSLERFKIADIVYLTCWTFFFAAARFINIPALFELLVI